MSGDGSVTIALACFATFIASAFIPPLVLYPFVLGLTFRWAWCHSGGLA